MTTKTLNVHKQPPKIVGISHLLDLLSLVSLVGLTVLTLGVAVTVRRSSPGRRLSQPATRRGRSWVVRRSPRRDCTDLGEGDLRMGRTECMKFG